MSLFAFFGAIFTSLVHCGCFHCVRSVTTCHHAQPASSYTDQQQCATAQRRRKTEMTQRSDKHASLKWLPEIETRLCKIVGPVCSCSSSAVSQPEGAVSLVIMAVHNKSIFLFNCIFISVKMPDWGLSCSAVPPTMFRFRRMIAQPHILNTYGFFIVLSTQLCHVLH